MTSRRTVLGGLAGGLAALVTGSAYSIARANGAAFKLGAVLPKTGPYSQFGDFVEQGLSVGVSEVNKLGGIAGRAIELLVRDDAGNPGRSLLAAKELVTEQKVDFLYPEIISSLVLAILPFSTEKKIVTMTNSAAAQVADTSKFPYSFSFTDPAILRIPPLMEAARKLGGHRVGILVVSQPTQVALGDALSAELSKSSDLKLAGYQKFGAQSTDYAPQLQSLKDAGADIVVFDANGRDGLRIVMTSMQALGWKAKVIGTPGLLYGDPTEQIPPSTYDQFYSLNYRVGTITKTPRSAALTTFVEELKAIRPIQNLAVCALARDTVYLIKWMHETAEKDSGNTNPESLVKALESLHERDYPDGYSLLLPNPRFRAGVHTPIEADFRKFWGLVRISKPVDGAYEGDDLDLPSAG